MGNESIDCSGGRFVHRSRCPACESPGPHPVLIDLPYDAEPMVSCLERFYSQQGHPNIQMLHGASYLLCECPKCGLLYQTMVPEQSLATALYGTWISPAVSLERKMRSASESAPRSIEEAWLVSQRFGTPEHTPKVLDYGMGWGQWCRAMQVFGCDAYGFEVSADRIAYASSIGIHVLNAEQIAADCFDFINLEQVLEHLEDPTGVVRWLAQSLADGGLLKIAVPNGNSARGRVRQIDWLGESDPGGARLCVWPLEHVNCFTRSSLEALANRCGLRRVSPLLRDEAVFVSFSGLRPFTKGLLRPLYRRRKASTYMWLARV